jgi:hypothetical protein
MEAYSNQKSRFKMQKYSVLSSWFLELNWGMKERLDGETVNGWTGGKLKNWCLLVVVCCFWSKPGDFGNYRPGVENYRPFGLRSKNLEFS